MIFVFKNKPYFLICFNKKNGARIKNIFLGPVLTKKNSKHYIEYLKKHLIKLEKYEKFSQKFNEEKKSIIAYLKNH
jgi:tRNA A22 N-methylase